MGAHQYGAGHKKQGAYVSSSGVTDGAEDHCGGGSAVVGMGGVCVGAYSRAGCQSSRRP